EILPERNSGTPRRRNLPARTGSAAHKRDRGFFRRTVECRVDCHNPNETAPMGREIKLLRLQDNLKMDWSDGHDRGFFSDDLGVPARRGPHGRPGTGPKLWRRPGGRRTFARGLCRATPPGRGAERTAPAGPDASAHGAGA